MAPFGEERACGAGFEVEFQSVGRACRADRLDEACGRVDLARGADRDEEIASRERVVDAVEVEGHFAEPDDVGAKLVLAGAGRAMMTGRKIRAPGMD